MFLFEKNYKYASQETAYQIVEQYLVQVEFHGDHQGLEFLQAVSELV